MVWEINGRTTGMMKTKLETEERRKEKENCVSLDFDFLGHSSRKKTFVFGATFFFRKFSFVRLVPTLDMGKGCMNFFPWSQAFGHHLPAQTHSRLPPSLTLHQTYTVGSISLQVIVCLLPSTRTLLLLTF